MERHENDTRVSPPPTRLRELCVAQSARRYPNSPHLEPAPVFAARGEFWRKSCGCRCRCSWCSGRKDREQISQESPLSRCALRTFGRIPCKTRSFLIAAAIVHGLRQARRSRPLSECKAVRHFARRTTIDTLCCTVWRSRPAVPLRRRMAPRKRRARAICCDNPARTRNSNPLHVDIPKIQSRSAGRSSSLRTTKARVE